MKILHQEDICGAVYERHSYTHSGGWTSYERGVRAGDLREIDGRVSKARHVEHRGLFRKPRVTWAPVRPEVLRGAER